MSNTSKSTVNNRKVYDDTVERRSKKSTSWNPFRKVMSIVTGKRHASLEGSSSSNGEKAIMRWTVSCLNTTCPIFFRNPQFNMIYSPAPSLLMYLIIILSSEHSMTKTLQRLFELNDSDIEEIREISSKLAELCSPNELYCFVRFLVDEEKTTTVSKELMIRSNEVATQQVFSSVRPSRVIKYLNTLTFSPVSMNRPPLLTTNGYGSAGLNARWVGKAQSAGIHRFACTYQKKKMEMFFEIKTTYRTVRMDQFDVFEVPFKFGPNDANFGSLLILRPHFIGHLPYANRQLTTEGLSKMLDDLYASSWIPQGTLLIPQFSASSCADLWKNLMRHGVQPDLGQSQKAPPMASLWHWAKLSVGSNGIDGNTIKKKKQEKQTESQKSLNQSFHDRVPSESLLEKHKAYSVRVDSPFTYLVMVQGIPLFTGSYFGNPPPRCMEIFVNAPERIRHRRTRVIRRQKEKETRKQKLLKKIKKSEEREKEKERRRRRQHLKNKRRSSSPTTSSDGSTTSESDSSKSSTPSSPEEKPEQAVEQVVKAEPKEKSKSSGWKRLANRIFRRKQ